MALERQLVPRLQGIKEGDEIVTETNGGVFLAVVTEGRVDYKLIKGTADEKLEKKKQPILPTE